MERPTPGAPVRCGRVALGCVLVAHWLGFRRIPSNTRSVHLGSRSATPGASHAFRIHGVIASLKVYTHRNWGEHRLSWRAYQAFERVACRSIGVCTKTRTTHRRRAHAISVAQRWLVAALQWQPCASATLGGGGPRDRVARTVCGLCRSLAPWHRCVRPPRSTGVLCT